MVAWRVIPANSGALGERGIFAEIVCAGFAAGRLGGKVNTCSLSSVSIGKWMER